MPKHKQLSRASPHSCSELLGHAEDEEGKEVDNTAFFFFHGLSALRVCFTFPSEDKPTQHFVSKHIKPKNVSKPKLNTIIL